MLNSVDLSSIPLPKLIDQTIYTVTLEKLSFIREVLLNGEYILAANKMPSSYSQILGEYIDDYNQIILGLQNFRHISEDRKLFQEVELISGKTTTLQNAITEISTSNKFLMAYNAIVSLATAKTYKEVSQIDMSKAKSITEELQHKAEDGMGYLEEMKSKINVFYSEVQKKATNLIVSDYAKIFGDEESKYETASNWWLAISIGSTILVVLFILLSFTHDWFNITTTFNELDDQGKIRLIHGYNYANLISKILVISLLIYLVTFFFKQFGINKHLKTVNNHRKNALNSYNNFATSIGATDTATRNALMLEVAKAIYDLGNTGYLSNKNSDNSPSGMIEFTRYVTQGKE